MESAGKVFTELFLSPFYMCFHLSFNEILTIYELLSCTLTQITTTHIQPNLKKKHVYAMSLYTQPLSKILIFLQYHESFQT